jgi:hypothetical protein
MQGEYLPKKKGAYTKDARSECDTSQPTDLLGIIAQRGSEVPGLEISISLSTQSKSRGRVYARYFHLCRNIQLQHSSDHEVLASANKQLTVLSKDGPEAEGSQSSGQCRRCSTKEVVLKAYADHRKESDDEKPLINGIRGRSQ